MQGLRGAARDAGVPACVQRVGSMITLFFREGPVRSWGDAAGSDTKRFAAWHGGMLARGVYLAPSAFEAGFVSSAHGEAEIAHTVKAARASFAELA